MMIFGGHQSEKQPHHTVAGEVEWKMNKYANKTLWSRVAMASLK